MTVHKEGILSSWKTEIGFLRINNTGTHLLSFAFLVKWFWIALMSWCLQKLGYNLSGQLTGAAPSCLYPVPCMPSNWYPSASHGGEQRPLPAQTSLSGGCMLRSGRWWPVQAADQFSGSQQNPHERAWSHSACPAGVRPHYQTPHLCFWSAGWALGYVLCWPCGLSVGPTSFLCILVPALSPHLIQYVQRILR